MTVRYVAAMLLVAFLAFMYWLVTRDPEPPDRMR